MSDEKRSSFFSRLFSRMDWIILGAGPVLSSRRAYFFEACIVMLVRKPLSLGFEALVEWGPFLPWPIMALLDLLTLYWIPFATIIIRRLGANGFDAVFGGGVALFLLWLGLWVISLATGLTLPMNTPLSLFIQAVFLFSFLRVPDQWVRQSCAPAEGPKPQAE